MSVRVATVTYPVQAWNVALCEANESSVISRRVALCATKRHALQEHSAANEMYQWLGPLLVRAMHLLSLHTSQPLALVAEAGDMQDCLLTLPLHRKWRLSAHIRVGRPWRAAVYS